MEKHKINELSESEEMYLLTIERLQQANPGQPLPLADLADALNFQPVSVNQMVRKLADQGLLHYQPYKGVTLAEAGRQNAQETLRTRRIWLTFLVEKLGLELKPADEIACRFEHITPQDVIEQLFAFLGEPSRAPDGGQILPSQDQPHTPTATPLSCLAAGQHALVERLTGPDASQAFLIEAGLHAGAVLEVQAVSEDGRMFVHTPQGKLSLTSELTAHIFVLRLSHARS